MTDDRRRQVPALMDHYEALRTFALGQAAAGPAPRGFALVLRHGVPAWIDAWVHCAAANVSTPPRPPAERLSALLPALHVEVATLLAEMALASVGR